jgi:N-methylhydantoinase B
MNISPIELEVVKNALLSVAEEMGVVLIRASQSTNIKERRDCSCGIFDSAGATIAQAEHQPMHLGSMLGIVSAILERYPLDQIHPGDMFITNDPYSGGGTHLPDITVAAPVFFDGEIIAFVVNIAHHSDVGGRVAGSNSGDCTSIFEEGLRIPLVKVVEGGTIVDRVLAFITLNCRTPEERLADLQAQVAANRVGIQRLQELAAKLGKDFLTAACQALLAHAERKIREAVRQIPDGTYTFEDYMDDDGRGMVKIPIRVTITVQGDDIHLDFAGSGPQARGGINFVWPALQGMVYFSLKAILDPTIPSNGGFFRAVRISAPTGTITNALPPAAMAGRSDTAQRVADVIFGALAPVIPEKVVAACNGAVTASMFSGFDQDMGRHYVYIETQGGGMGARHDRDGLDGVQVHATNTSNLPVEALENEYPLMVDCIELIPDSGGRGKFRGGLGIRKDIRVVGHTATFSTHADRQHLPPWGLFGGEPGRCGRYVITRVATGERKVLPSGKMSEILLEEGDVVSVQTPGAGGWGPPGERPSHLLEKDLRQGKVSTPPRGEVSRHQSTA